jgi:hypothetical protein
MFSQTNENKSLCLEYTTIIPSIDESYKNSEYIFIGKVIKIIRTESLKATDYTENGYVNFVPEFNYWYILDVSEVFKGNPFSEIKIFARQYSGIYSVLELDKEYLIYTTKMAEFEIKHFKHSDSYIYCGDRSKKNDKIEPEINQLRKLKKTSGNSRL